MMTDTCQLPGHRRIGVLLWLCLSAVAAPGSAAICRVTADTLTPGNGSNWDAAAMTLKTALDTPACTEVWVKAGLYVPGDSPEDTFNVRPGLAVYGGFAGTELERQQRNVAANVTILSGDIGADDENEDRNHIAESTLMLRGENSTHVVRMNGTTAAGPVQRDTVLDGFVITAGAAYGAEASAAGGGLLCEGSGTGHDCSPTLGQLDFAGNAAGAGGGAAFLALNGGVASPLLSEVSFRGNEASNGGGGLFFDGTDGHETDPELVAVGFYDNYAQLYGGALRIDSVNGDAHPRLRNVTFSSNTGGAGAAIAIRANPGIATPNLNNVTFADNNAMGAGVIYLEGDGYGHVQMTIGNSILHDVGNGEFYNVGGEVYLGYSIVTGGCPATGSLCWNLVTADPQLGPLAWNGGSTRTRLPATTSPAIDAGDNGHCPAFDQRGIARPQRGGCDIGAVEVLAEIIFANGFEG